MKYFFLAYAILAALFIGLMPNRGDMSVSPPIRLFPDMDEQDYLRAQRPDDFFADGMGARHPVPGSHPIGFEAEGKPGADDLVPEYEFGGGTGYYQTGVVDDYFGNGLPEEIMLTEANAASFLREGRESYNIHCLPCHGASGDGQGITTSFGMPGVANLVLANYGTESYPDGRMFDVISNGKGNMGPYKHNIPLHQRWAIVAYVRALQAARSAPLSDPDVRQAFARAIADGIIPPPDDDAVTEIPEGEFVPSGGVRKPDGGVPEATSPEVEDGDAGTPRPGAAGSEPQPETSEEE